MAASGKGNERRKDSKFFSLQPLLLEGGSSGIETGELFDNQAILVVSCIEEGVQLPMGGSWIEAGELFDDQAIHMVSSIEKGARRECRGTQNGLFDDEEIREGRGFLPINREEFLAAYERRAPLMTKRSVECAEGFQSLQSRRALTSLQEVELGALR